MNNSCPCQINRYAFQKPFVTLDVNRFVVNSYLGVAFCTFYRDNVHQVERF